MRQSTTAVSGHGPNMISQQEIAHKLLIELLACQFAFPVRWIETQDEILSKDPAITRLIEFGPAKILGGMAKQTVDVKYRSHDVSRSINRQFLSSVSDKKDIEYAYDPPADEPSQPAESSETLDVPADLPKTETAPNSEPQQATVLAAEKMADEPVKAIEILQGLVARKFNNKFTALDLSQSIKHLSGGKSTLQNELIGILSEEFGNLPGGAEDLPISALGNGIQPSFSGGMGKESSSVISRLVSTRMPAGFSQVAIREHLENSWGLGNGRQTTVLLFAITMEPPSRLPSVSAAKEYFDGLAAQYAAHTGIQLSKASPSKTQATTAMVDSKHLQEIREERQEMLQQNFNLLASQLRIDPSNEKRVMELENMLKDNERRLDLWTSEFDTDFETGITSSFDPLKRRLFNSWWNLVREDVLALYHSLMTGLLRKSSPELDDLVHKICNRSTKSVQDMVEHLFTQILTSKPSDEDSSLVGRRLSEQLKSKACTAPTFVFSNIMTAPQTTITADGIIEYKEVAREIKGISDYAQLLERGTLNDSAEQTEPFVQLKTYSSGAWVSSSEKTNLLLANLHRGINSGISFSEKTILLTGASPDSIGAEVLRGLLMGGARVIVTTSRLPAETAKYYQGLYAECGARGSELVLLHFNQGNKQDCEALVEYIYSDSGLAANLDAVIPFAAIPEGAEIDGIGAKSELAHRVMLVNVVRLLGHIARIKDTRQINTRPTQVLLPLSPNHGIFGGDGLYSESKLGLESLLNRFNSENWSEYLTICGAVIGWTRGTGLMSNNDLIAQSIEQQNVLTFSQREMAFNLLSLMSQDISQMCELEPILADMDGGLRILPDLKDLLSKSRADITITAKIRAAVREEDLNEKRLLEGPRASADGDESKTQVKHRSTIMVGYPRLPDYERDLKPLCHLKSMVSPESVPVVVGFSELGPWGSSRTRWEMESTGTFSQEGYLEMAWLMNLIKYHEGEKDGQVYAGWVDAKTEEPIHDSEIATKYGTQIMDHAGIRLIEPELFGGYDPDRKEYMHEVAIEEDLPEFEVTEAVADAFKLRHEDQISIRQCDSPDKYKVQLKKGAVISVPKAVPFEGVVAGQIPTGWDPRQYGIPDDIVKQVDPVTLYSLCCASEALYSAGISESTEMFKHIHVSEVGNFIGSMMGGTTKTRHMYKDRYMDREVQGDVMQETYLSTTAAWINMLLLGASGPIKTPTGACATAVESIDSACESLLSGKTKICFVGGTDDFQEEESYAFRTMKATVNAREELAKGRLPGEMSRPTADTRAGFLESQGAGVQIVTTAKVALQMGLPIYGIIACSTMAADKISRSVPAPGKGVLSFARETSEASSSPLLHLDYRRKQLCSSMKDIRRWRDARIDELSRGQQDQLSPDSLGNTDLSGTSNDADNSSYLAAATSTIDKATNARIAEVRKLWGTDFRRQDPEISPVRAALAVWGLSVDDIDIASLHGTSTKANDTNESDIINKQMTHLGRHTGKPLMAICQKSLTGHPKAPAGAFMLNGCLQALNTGLVPGNRNADNVDAALASFPQLVFPTRPIQTSHLKAFSLTSFGFGQKGGQIIGVHPRYLFATLDREAYDEYSTKVATRTQLANRSYLQAMMTNRVVKLKSEPVCSPGVEAAAMLDPLSRVSEMTEEEGWRFDRDNLRPGREE